jgi:hypothetical protein
MGLPEGAAGGRQSSIGSPRWKRDHSRREDDYRTSAAGPACAPSPGRSSPPLRDGVALGALLGGFRHSNARRQVRIAPSFVRGEVRSVPSTCRSSPGSGRDSVRGAIRPGIARSDRARAKRESPASVSRDVARATGTGRAFTGSRDVARATEHGPRGRRVSRPRGARDGGRAARSSGQPRRGARDGDGPLVPGQPPVARATGTGRSVAVSRHVAHARCGRSERLRDAVQRQVGDSYVAPGSRLGSLTARDLSGL